jgi:hypothetical protein
MPEGFNPQGDEQVFRKEHIVVGDMVGMMRSFQRMSEALIHHLDRDEARASTPPEGPPCAPCSVLVEFIENSRSSSFPSYSVPKMCSLQGMVGEYGDVL